MIWRIALRGSLRLPSRTPEFFQLRGPAAGGVVSLRSILQRGGGKRYEYMMVVKGAR